MLIGHSKKTSPLQDVQNSPASVPVPIDRVGVRGVTLPLVACDRAQGRQHTVAEADLGVELPAAFKGTHMSRFVEALESFDGRLDYASLRRLLEDIKARLDARKAYILLRFPYFLRKGAPATGSTGLVRYDCRLTGELAASGPSFLLEVDVPVMTVCPCSKAISREGAHSQRAMVRLAVCLAGFAWIEDFIDIAESAASSPVYTLLKREDEKYVTEHAFANPAFVEDVVRRVAEQLAVHPHVARFMVEVESFESIHAHNAFARIDWTESGAEE